MHRLLLLSAFALVVGTGCRTQRSWFATIGMARGATCPGWMATRTEDIQQGMDARNCAAGLVSVGEGLEVTIIEDDTWVGECWVELELSLASDAPDTTEAVFEFAFDLCNEVGEDCPTDLADTVQQRTLTVASDVLDGSVEVPDGCGG